MPRNWWVVTIRKRPQGARAPGSKRVEISTALLRALGVSYREAERGQNRAIQTPTNAKMLPMRSPRSGFMPSKT